MNTRIALLASLVTAPLIAGAAPAVSNGRAEGPAGVPAGPDEHAKEAAGNLESMKATLSVPLFSERFASVPVAAVEDDVITLAHLNALLAATHEGRTSRGGVAKGKDFASALDRLIEIRLLVGEARDMELDKLADVKAAIDTFKDMHLRELIERRATAAAKADPMEVEQRYRDAVREWKLRSIRFTAEEDAKAFHEAIKAGKGYDTLAKEAFASKKGTGSEAADWAGASSLAPNVRDAVAPLSPGGSTPPVRVEGGFAVVHVDDVRYPEDPAARARAEAESLDRSRGLALLKYRADLFKKYAKVDVKLLQSLDFEARSPGFEVLRKDKRAIVKIQGEKPITVGDLAAELSKGFFHGIEGPLKEKRVNSHKDEAIRVMTTKRLFRKEAARLGIASGAEYRDQVADYEREQLFGKLVEKVIVPDVKVPEVDGKDYYEKHKAEFTYPAMYKLEGIAFTTKQAAEAALKRLQGGTEFNWLRANADGRVKQGDEQLPLQGGTYSAAALPPDLLERLTGAGKNDLRLFDGPKSQFYVIHVLDQTPPAEQPYKVVREGIAKRLFAENLSKAIKEYAAKLRDARRVEVYITRIGG